MGETKRIAPGQDQQNTVDRTTSFVSRTTSFDSRIKSWQDDLAAGRHLPPIPHDDRGRALSFEAARTYGGADIPARCRTARF
jgi:hypothetical protein